LGEVRAESVTLHYEEWPGEGPAVLGIPGLTANRFTFEPLARALPGRHVVALDLRGRGLSDKPPGAESYGLLQHAEDVSAAIEALGLGPVVLAGHSMGAYVGVLLAVRHPEQVRALALVEGGYPDPEWTDESLRELISAALTRLRMTFPSVEAYFDYWRGMPFLGEWSPELERYFTADLVERAPGEWVSRTVPEAAERDLTDIQHDFDGAELLPRAPQPAVLINAPVGLADPARPLYPRHVFEEAVKLLPSGRLVVVEGTNHYTVLLTEAGASVVAQEILRL
jgi:pimeloyl-ACP methyl ester carboxylesterase